MKPWWQDGVIYQIYPRSFSDSNADGIGDLEGIRQRLDYLEWLGVTGLWLNPINPVAEQGLGLRRLGLLRRSPRPRRHG